MITLITPLLLLVGMGVAGFAAKFDRLGCGHRQDRLPRGSTFVLLVPLLAWQCWGVVVAALARFQEAPTTEALASLNALGIQ